MRVETNPHGKEEDFIGNITYVGCDEVEKMYNIRKKEAGGEVTDHVDVNHLVIGALSGVILILILTIVSYFFRKRCKKQTHSQVTERFAVAQMH